MKNKVVYVFYIVALTVLVSGYNACGRLISEKTQETVLGSPFLDLQVAAYQAPDTNFTFAGCFTKVRLKDESSGEFQVEIPLHPYIQELDADGDSLAQIQVPPGVYSGLEVWASDQCSSSLSLAVTNNNGSYKAQSDIVLKFSGRQVIHSGIAKISLYVEPIAKNLNSVTSDSEVAPQSSVSSGTWAVFESWKPLNMTGAPDSARYSTGIWTGTEMIVWGGSPETREGGRYNLQSNQWLPTTLNGAPTARYLHSAVWTGSEMIIWGGSSVKTGIVATGGRYDPSLDKWTPVNTVGAPEARYNHVAVWTGSEMIIWGGDGCATTCLSGAKYNPATNSWTPISSLNAPQIMDSPHSVWTGTEMLVWGNQTTQYPKGNDIGGKYNPSTDVWTPMSSINAPIAKTDASAVWTGTEMIIWSGNFHLDDRTGARYNPLTNSWTTMNTVNAPKGRALFKALWTGSKMLIWGGYNYQFVNEGGLYDPVKDEWSPVTKIGAPTPRFAYVAVWTGQEAIYFGGNETGTAGPVYDAALYVP